MEIKDIIKQRRTELGLTLLDVAKLVGVSEATVSRWESGNISNMRRDKIHRLAKALQLPTSYLAGYDTEENSGTIPEHIKSIPIAKNIIPIPRSSRKVPLLGKIACGVPVLAEENIDDYVDLPDNIDADFCLKCVGDSMEGARIMDGDIVYIHQQPMVDDGEIAAVMIDNEATLKRVYYDKEHDTLQLVAENPKYRPFVYHGTQLDEIKIIGRAVAFLSRVRK